MADQRSRLRHLPSQGGNSNRISVAIQRLRKEPNRPLSVEGLAKELGMSPSGFHYHFKAITDMSPLQFQKQIRLDEAGRLVLGENLDASSAGCRVRNNDPADFSKDYEKRFGNLPASDAVRLSAMVAADRVPLLTRA